MSIFKVILLSLGVFGYLFFYWKRLKEDYISSQIFPSGFFILFGAVLGSLILNRINPLFWFWGGFLGAVIGFSLSIFKLKLKILETLEAAGVGLLIPLGLTFQKYSPVLVLIGLFFFLEARYKKLSWYRSGRVGFSGLVVLGIFFLLRGVVAIFLPTMLFYVDGLGKIDAVISVGFAFAFFWRVFSLSK